MTSIAGPHTLNRPLAFAMASVSALFLALVGVLGQLATRELFVLPALFLRYLASTVVVLVVLRSDGRRTLATISRLDWLRVGSVLISQFCFFYYLNGGSLLIGMLLYNTGPGSRPTTPGNHVRNAHCRESRAGICRRGVGLESLWRTPGRHSPCRACVGLFQFLLAACLPSNEPP